MIKMANVCIHFSDFFDLDPAVLRDYGAFDSSLIADAPVFIDPFRLYASDKDEYGELHRYVIRYLCFLKDLCLTQRGISQGTYNQFFKFPEVKNLYMGFSKTGNCGKGLGIKFARMLQENFRGPLLTFGDEKISESSHLEKLCVVSPGVGKDFISDFSANLLKGFLLRYTQDFAKKHLRRDQCGTFGEGKAVFNFDKQDWQPDEFYLPVFKDDYVLLAPRDILTRDETWISHRGLLCDLKRLPQTIGNEALRAKLEDLLLSIELAERKIPTAERVRRYNRFILDNIEIADWYIKNQEAHKSDAVMKGESLVSETERILVAGTRDAASELAGIGFYDGDMTCMEAVRRRIGFFKSFVEDNDGYKLFFDSQGKKVREELVQLAFRLLWYGSTKDVNREVNNGRGPCDFKISLGSGDQCIIEIKWASNTRIASNLACQARIYARANGTSNKISIVLYTKESELGQVMKIIQDKGLSLGSDVVLIDATPHKLSASKVDELPGLPAFDFDIPEFDFL